jgi:four helix bundle protein
MFSYENLAVYKKAFAVNQKVYRLLKQSTMIPVYAKNQLGRASLSVMLNIAEGSAKFSARDRRNFYITARGSVFECSSLVSFLFEENEIGQSWKEEFYSSYEEISKILFTMIKNLEKNKSAL